MGDVIAFFDAFVRLRLGRPGFLRLGADVALEIAALAALLIGGNRSLLGLIDDVAVVVPPGRFGAAGSASEAA